MTQETSLPEILGEEIAAAAKCFGIQPQVAADLASATLERVRLRCGGTAMYLRKDDKARRNKDVFDAFTGDNLDELVRKFHRSKRQIERIIEQERQRRALTRQSTGQSA
jgi:Mor family transcriptional regulator